MAVALLVAAGRGTRLGSDGPKALVVVAGRPMLDWSLDDVALVVPHQVSRSVIERVASLLGYPFERCMTTLERFGNTAAASIPVALDVAIEDRRVGAGDKVLLVGGAAGFSAAVVPLVI